MKIIYEVMAVVDPTLGDRFEDFMAERHLSAMMATGFFLSATLTRSVDRFQMRYTVIDRATFDRYLAGPGEDLRADTLKHFPTGVRFDREVWHVIAEYNSV